MQHLSRHWESKGKAMTRTEVENLIREQIIGRNAERNRKILHRRLIDGITFDKLAEEYDLSVRQVKNIVYKGTDMLFR